MDICVYRVYTLVSFLVSFPYKLQCPLTVTEVLLKSKSISFLHLQKTEVFCTFSVDLQLDSL